MKKLTHTIQAHTCPEAWVAATEYVLGQPKHEAYYLALAIESPEKMTPNDFLVHDQVDQFLRSYDEEPVTTVAGTIFPANHYMRDGVKGVYESFPATFPRIKGRSWGTYAMRMMQKEGKNETVRPLKFLVEKMKANLKLMRGAYEINLVADESFEMPIYQVEKDKKKLRGQPCLSHLSFKVYHDGTLTLCGIYRSHFYISKAFGNFIGLAQLQSFVAAETGLAVGPLICYSTHARIDTNPWNLTEIRALISRCKAALLAQSPDQE
jgi:hypothetical protein